MEAPLAFASMTAFCWEKIENLACDGWCDMVLLEVAPVTQDVAPCGPRTEKGFTRKK